MYSLLLFTYLYTLKLKFFILSFNKILFICFMIISIKNIFHGTNPTLSTISKICSGFGITVSEFFQADYFLICEDD